MKVNLKNAIIAIVIIAVLFVLVYLLPVKVLFIIIFLMQLVTLIAIGGTNLNMQNFSRHEQIHEED